MLSSNPSAASHQLGALLASLGSDDEDCDDGASILTNDMILDMMVAINNQDVEPSVVPGSLRSKQVAEQVEAPTELRVDVEGTRAQLKEQEDRLR